MFKVGDVVKIKSFDEIIKHDDCVEGMHDYAGKFGIVEEVIESEVFGISYRITTDEWEWLWYDSMLEYDIEDEMMEENIDE